MSARLIPKDKDYPRLSKATSGYVENPYFEKSDLNTGYFCNDCVYFINGNDCAIVRKDGPDVNGEESGTIAPHGICTLWVPDETKTNLVFDLVKLGRKIKEAFGAMDNISKFKKFSKLKASYIEYDKFADSNLRQGYFCYNCIYWVNTLGGQCMLVKNEGPDVMGRESSVIAPHGCCAGYEPNFDKIDDTRKGERHKELKTTDVTDDIRLPGW